MNTNLVIVNSLEEKLWREFVSQHPSGNIFHTPEMFKVFGRSIGYKPKLWAALNNYGEIQALLLPVQVCLINGLLHRLTTRSIAYGGVLSANSPEGNSALEFLLNTYSERTGKEVLFTEIRNLSDVNTIQPILTQCGFAFEDHLNYLIDLDSSPTEVLQNFGSRTRKHIRQALRKGAVIVEEMEDLDLLPKWYELVRKSYAAASVPLADITLFKAAFEILYPKNMVKFWTARYNNNIVAVSVELVYKDIVFGWYGGVDRAYSSYTPSELLMWEILKWGVENGYHVYDFGGAGTPDEDYGVRDFKAKFGGQLVCFGRNTFVHTPGLLRISTAGYELYRRFL